MKIVAISGVLLMFALAGCSTEEPAEPTAPAAPAPVVEEQPQAEAPAPVESDDAQPEMVEESAAEPEDEGDKPLLLAQADAQAAEPEWKFTEGEHFTRMVPTQPTVGGADKIEVAEVFWYGCAHCLTFEPYINRWDESKPANVRFVRIPATWNDLVLLHAKLFYTEEVLVKNGKIEEPERFRAAVFAEYHNRRNMMSNEAAIQAIFERFGVSADDFQKTWNSFEVAQKLRVAQDLARRYTITGVPTVVVNGKYRTGAREAGGYPQLIQVIDELVERESVR